MKLALVGVGRAGTRIVDRLLEREAAAGRNFCNGNAIVFDTAEDAFEDVEYVPETGRVQFGDIHPAVGPDGVDGDPDLGVEVAREDVYELRRAFDAVEFTEVDGALLVAGLGGATGGGAGAVLLEELQEICDDPVYALAVLPGADEPDRRALTAARALQSFVTIADNVLLFDNETWRSREERRRVLEYGADGTAGDDEADAATETAAETPAEQARADDEAGRYDERNRVAATRVLSLLGAGELQSMTIGENRIDASDVARTLETGGVSTIGQATMDLDRPGWVPAWMPLPSWLPARLRSWLEGGSAGSGPTDAAKVKRLVRRAVDSRLTLPCEVSSAERTLIVLSGPPSAVSRKGFESARHWLESEADTVDVLAGDEPRPRASTLTATVLLSNVTEVPRIDDLQERAVAAQDALDVDRDAEADPKRETEFIW